MDFFVDFLSNNFSNCVWLAIILVSMIPTIESKIALPLALNVSIWGNAVLSPFQALLFSFLGSLIPCYLIMLTVRYLKNKTTGFMTNRFISKYLIRSSKIERGNSNLKKYILLTCLVSLPLPLTGVWSGSLIAGLSRLNIHYSFISIAIGSLISSLVMLLLCCLFTNSISYIMIISLILIIVFLIAELLVNYIKSFLKKKNA